LRYVDPSPKRVQHGLFGMEDSVVIEKEMADYKRVAAVGQDVVTK
jgi:hypothetical protein